jgi:hypothetical protein
MSGMQPEPPFDTNPYNAPQTVFEGEIVGPDGATEQLLAESRRILRRIGCAILVCALLMIVVPIATIVFEAGPTPLTFVSFVAGLMLLPASIVFLVRRPRGAWQSDLRWTILWAIIVSPIALIAFSLAFFAICIAALGT